MFHCIRYGGIWLFEFSQRCLKITHAVYHIQLWFKCIQLCNPTDYSLSGSTVHGDSPGKNTKVGCHAHLQWICPTQGSNLGLLHCKWILQSQPPGKPKNTGVCSLSLLQGIFLTQESNQGLLHCRRVLYQLSYQESPNHKNFP